MFDKHEKIVIYIHKYTKIVIMKKIEKLACANVSSRR